MNLVIVESPTKARTLGKFLGENYKIEASYGHIRDLPQKKLGVKINKDFEPEYVQTSKQIERTKEIKRLSKDAGTIYLATDPDREGEAIAWHINEVLRTKPARNATPARQPDGSHGGGQSVAGGKEVLRVTFHEITKHAIDEALKNPKSIDMQLVEAQQARRILDRLVGYKLSPLLWKKIRRGLSAGRVQSVAVRLVVEREREIEAFKPEEYWEIFVNLQKIQGSMFKVQLVAEMKNQYEAEIAEKDLLNTEYRVLNIEKKEFKRTPPAPFTTSTLQQAAANRLGWSAKRTMQVAQGLYEEGHITYHRTDSTNIAAEAAIMSREFIVANYGKDYALDKPRIYKTKSKVAQEAHEAIRPTALDNKNIFSNHDQQKLYEMIWTRFVACQMAEVLGETTKITVKAGEYSLEAKGEIIKFDGWYKASAQEKEKSTQLPEVTEGEKLEFVNLTKEQKFTQPSARYNDASLIKALEEMGIGRPSTYAPTLSTIQDRQYVEKIEKRFKPTSLGLAVNDFLVANFPNIVDYEFTANMEYGLDEVAAGEKKWQPLLAEFYTPFAKQLEGVTQTAERVKIEVEMTGEKCPKCGQGEVIIRLGKFGKFLACSRYPECDYKANYQNKTGQKCPKCGDPARNASQSDAGGGDVIIRKTRSGRSFFGCSNYPKCDFASWTRPSPTATAGQAKPK